MLPPNPLHDGLGQSKPRKSIEKLAVKSGRKVVWAWWSGGGGCWETLKQEQEQLFALLAAASKSA